MMGKRSYFTGLLMAAVLALVFMAPAWAQTTTGTILGVVKDASQGIIPGATVTVKNTGTGVARSLVTDDQGAYRAPNLTPGTYEVTVELVGFKTSTVAGINLTVGREAVVDLTLQPGDVVEQVTVTGEGRLVNTVSATIEGLISEQEIRELPLNSRDYLQLTTLAPGVLVMRGQRDAISPQTGTGLNMSISGGRPQQNNFRVDGVSTNDHANTSPGATTGTNLGVEAIKEFSVMTNTYSAEFGRSAGGVINAVTRSGTNDLHGTGFYFHRNNNFDARNFFNPGELPDFRRHQFGAALGGPIIKNKTFFFGNYESLREELAQTAISTVLTASARSGNLLSGPVVVNAAMQRYIELFPLPNGPILGDTGTFFSEPNRSTRQNFGLIRGDHNFNASTTLNSSYIIEKADIEQPDSLLANDVLSPSKRQFVSAELTKIVTNRLVNAMRFGYGRSALATGILRGRSPQMTDPALGFLPGRPVGIYAIAGLTQFPGGEGAADTEDYLSQSFQFYENATYQLGRHFLKAGMNFEILRDRLRSASAENGSYSFDSIPAFLTNQPATFQAQLAGSDTERFIRQSIWGFYVQDDVRWTDRLSMNLGLRYEFATEPSERDGQSATLREFTSTEPTVGLFYVNPPKHNFAPRLGLAWDPTGSGKTSVRAGFGMFYDLILPYYLTNPATRMPPHFLRGQTPRGTLPQGAFPSQAYPILLGQPTPRLTADWIEYEPKTGYRVQYNLNVQHQLLKDTVVMLGYVGGRGINIGRLPGDGNVAPVYDDLGGGVLFFPAGQRTINPVFGRMRIRNFDGNSFYNAGQLGINQKVGTQLRFQFSYTFSKSIDDGSTTFTTNQYNNSVNAKYPPRRDLYRGLSDYDVRHNLVLNGTWDLPWKSEKMAGLVNGWQIAGIFSASSGTPFSVQIAGDRARTLASTTGQTPNLAPGASNNQLLETPEHWFDPFAFTWPDAGFLGNVGRNTLFGPAALQRGLHAREEHGDRQQQPSAPAGAVQRAQPRELRHAGLRHRVQLQRVARRERRADSAHRHDQSSDPDWREVHLLILGSTDLRGSSPRRSVDRSWPHLPAIQQTICGRRQ
jgi:hypothetical protein